MAWRLPVFRWQVAGRCRSLFDWAACMHAYQRRSGDVYMHVAAFEKGINII
jgi:hypothetical protein